MSQATTELVWFPYFNFIYLSVDFLSYSGITANHPAIGLSRPGLCKREKIIQVVVTFYSGFRI